MMTKRGFKLLLVSVLAGALMFPLGGMTQAAEKGGTMISMVGHTPGTLSAAISYTLTTAFPSYCVYNALITYDSEGNMLPELAKSWEFAPDGKTWTFHLEKGVKWHDGRDFTSEDVAFTIKEIFEPYHPLGKQAFGPVSRIETPDPHTVVFKFEKPHTPALSYLSPWFAVIMPKHLFEGTDILKNPQNLAPVGTGPYMFEEYKKGSHITLLKNPNYWRKGRPYLDKVIFRIITDAPARIVAFDKGEIDAIPCFWAPYAEAQRFREEGATVVAYEPLHAPILLVPLNLKNQYLSNQKVRWALSHAVNRQEIIDKAYFGFGKVAVGPIPSTIRWAFTDDVRKFEYSPEKANQLLDEAGYKKGSDGIRFSLDYPYVGTNTEWDRAARIIQANLRDVGIDVKLRSFEYTACQKEVFQKRNFDLSFWLLAMGPDPSVGTARLYLTSQMRVTTGPTNGMSYSNPEVDRLFTEGPSQPTREAAGEYYKKVQKLMVEDMPCLWISEPPYIIVYNSKLQGLPDNPYGGLGKLEEVSWEK